MPVARPAYHQPELKRSLSCEATLKYESGIYGVAAKDREVGTDSHRRYAQSMVPGQEEIKNFNIREFINRYKIKK